MAGLGRGYLYDDWHPTKKYLPKDRDEINLGLAEIDPNERILNIMAHARNKTHARVWAEVEQRIEVGEFTREQFLKEYVIVEWSEMKDLSYVFNCSIVKRDGVGSVVITDMLGKKFTIHHAAPLTDKQIIMV
jgi:hypothetical protein